MRVRSHPSPSHLSPGLSSRQLIADKSEWRWRVAAPGMLAISSYYGRTDVHPDPPRDALRSYFSDATHEIERLRPTERQTVQICGKHGGIECTMRALRQIIDRSTPAELCSCGCTVLISTKTCRGKQMCTRAAREAISDNHTVCWSAHSADCRALPSRSISSDACTTRPSPGACGPP